MTQGLVCTTRFDPSLEAFEWNNAPDGSPSPYLLLSFQLDRLLSSVQLCRWSVSHPLDYTALRHICDDAVHKLNGTGRKTPLKVVATQFVVEHISHSVHQVRVVYASSGDITASACPVEPLRSDPTAGPRFNPGIDSPTQFDPILSICIDTQPTSGTGPMKTTDRQPYDDARMRVGIPPLGAPRAHGNTPDDVILFNASGGIMESSICNLAFYRRGRWVTPPLTAGCISGVFRRWLLENGLVYEESIFLDAIENNELVLLFNSVMGCRLGRVYRGTTRGPGASDP